MKTLRMFKGNRVWFTELSAAIAENDLLNEIKACLAEYKRHLAKPAARKVK